MYLYNVGKHADMVAAAAERLFNDLNDGYDQVIDKINKASNDAWQKLKNFVRKVSEGIIEWVESIDPVSKMMSKLSGFTNFLKWL